jgi:hypothetical protein
MDLKRLNFFGLFDANFANPRESKSAIRLTPIQPTQSIFRSVAVCEWFVTNPEGLIEVDVMATTPRKAQRDAALTGRQETRVSCLSYLEQSVQGCRFEPHTPLPAARVGAPPPRPVFLKTEPLSLVNMSKNYERYQKF